MKELKEIEINNIIVEGQLVREEIDPDHVDELAMSILRHGLLNPITVKKIEDGKYQLMAGRHRIEAFKKLNRQKIPAYIIDSDAPVKAVAGVENIVRLQMTPREEAEVVKYLHEIEGLSPAQISDLTGKGREWVLRRLAFFQFPQDVVEALENKEISYGHAELIARLKDEAQRNYIKNAIIQQRLTISQTKRLVETFEEMPEIDDAIQKGLEEARTQEIESAKTTKLCPVCQRYVEIINTVWVELCKECWDELKKSLEKEE